MHLTDNAPGYCAISKLNILKNMDLFEPDHFLQSEEYHTVIDVLDSVESEERETLQRIQEFVHASTNQLLSRTPMMVHIMLKTLRMKPRFRSVIQFTLIQLGEILKHEIGIRHFNQFDGYRCLFVLSNSFVYDDEIIVLILKCIRCQVISDDTIHLVSDICLKSIYHSRNGGTEIITFFHELCETVKHILTTEIGLSYFLAGNEYYRNGFSSLQEIVFNSRSKEVTSSMMGLICDMLRRFQGSKKIRDIVSTSIFTFTVNMLHRNPGSTLLLHPLLESISHLMCTGHADTVLPKEDLRSVFYSMQDPGQDKTLFSEVLHVLFPPETLSDCLLRLRRVEENKTEYVKTLCLLHNLIISVRFAECFINEDGIDIFVSLFDTIGQDSLLQEDEVILETLCQVILGVAQFQNLLHQEDRNKIIQIARAMIQKFPQNSTIFQCSLGMLVAVFTTSEESAVAWKDEFGFNKIVANINPKDCDPGVVTALSEFCNVILRYASTRNELIAQGCMRILLNLFERNVSNSKAASLILSTFHLACISSTSLMSDLIRIGVVKTISQSLLESTIRQPLDVAIAYATLVKEIIPHPLFADPKSRWHAILNAGHILIPFKNVEQVKSLMGKLADVANKHGLFLGLLSKTEETGRNIESANYAPTKELLLELLDQLQMISSFQLISGSEDIMASTHIFDLLHYVLQILGHVRLLCAVPVEVLDEQLAFIVVKLPKRPEFVTTEYFESVIKFSINSNKDDFGAFVFDFVSRILESDHSFFWSIVHRNCILEDIITLRSKFPRNYKILTSAVSIFSAISESEPEIIIKFLPTGLLDILVDGCNVSNVSCAVSVLKIIENINHDEDAVTFLLMHGIYFQVIKRMKEFIYSSPVQRSAICCIGGVVDRSDLMVKLIEDHEIIHLLAEIMSTHLDNAEIIELAVFLVESLVIFEQSFDQADRVLSRLGLASSLLIQNEEALEAIESINRAVLSNRQIQERREELRAHSARTMQHLLKELLTKDDLFEISVTVDVLNRLKVIACFQGSSRILDELNCWVVFKKILRKSNFDSQVLCELLELLNESLSKDFILQKSSFSGFDNLDKLQVLLSKMLLHLAKENIFTNIDHEVILNLLKFISMTCSNYEYRQIYVEDGIFPTLWEMLRFFSSDLVILDQIVGTISYFVKDLDIVTFFAHEENLSFLFDMILEHQDQEVLLLSTIRFLYELSNWKPLEELIVSMKLTKSILRVLSDFKANRDIVFVCLQLLDKVAAFYHFDFIEKFSVSDYKRYILETIEAYCDDEGILEPCFRIFQNFFKRKNWKTEYILGRFDMTVLIDATLRCSSSPSVTRASFPVLLNSISHSPGLEIFLRLDGLRAVIAGAAASLDDSSVATFALMILCHVAAYDTSSLNVVCHAHGLNCGIDLLDRQCKNSDCVSRVIAFLHIILSPDDSSFDTAIVLGAIRGMSTAILDNALETSILRSALGVCVTLTDNLQYEDIATLLLDSSSITQAVVSSIEKYESSALLISNGLKLLRNLSSSATDAQMLQEQGAIASCILVVDRALKDSSAKPLKEALLTLSILVQSDVVASTVALKAVEIMKVIMQTFYKNFSIMESLFIFIANLCAFEQSSDLFMSATTLEGLYEYLNTHQSRKDVILQGLRIVENISYTSPDLRTRLENVGFKNKILSFADIWSTDVEVVTRCKSAFDALVGTSVRPKVDFQKTFKHSSTMDTQNTPDDIPLDLLNRLLKGHVFLRHSHTDSPQKCHVFLSSNMMKIVFEDQVKKSKKRYIYLNDIKAVETGRCTPQLLRKTALGQFRAKKKCSFALICHGESLSLEASSERERDEWSNAFTEFIDFRHGL